VYSPRGPPAANPIPVAADTLCMTTTFADLFERAAEYDVSAEAVNAALVERRSASGDDSGTTTEVASDVSDTDDLPRRPRSESGPCRRRRRCARSRPPRRRGRLARRSTRYARTRGRLWSPATRSSTTPRPWSPRSRTTGWRPTGAEQSRRGASQWRNPRPTTRRWRRRTAAERCRS